MAEYLIICLPTATDKSASWAVLDASGGLAALPEKGELSHAATMAAGRQVVLVVPGEDVFITQINLPTQKRQKVLQALPYALEDQLADEVERLHFALGPVQDEGAYPVAVVARERMDHWLEQSAAAGLSPDIVVADVMLLPYNSDAGWSAAVDQHRVLFRTGTYEAFAVDRASAAAVLTLAVNDSDPVPTRLIQYSCSEQAEALVPAAGLEAVQESCEGGLPGLLARHFQPDTLINLIQGDYSRKEQISQLWRPWRATAALLVAGLLVVAAQMGLEYRVLRAEQARLTQRVEQIYRTTFPNAKRVVNPRAQMQQRLVELRRGTSEGGGSFLQILALSGPVLKAATSVRLQGISYREGRMDLDLVVGNLQILDQLKQRLASDGKLAVEIQSAAADENQQVKSRLRLRRVGT